MRTFATAAVLVATLVAGAVRADAATLQVAFTVDGFRDIEIPITTFPGEFQAVDSSWGGVTYGGGLVGYWVLGRDDLRHAGSLAPTVYPNPLYTIAIRTVGAPSQLLILSGASHPLPGGGIVGGVTVATGALAFLRGATFTTAIVNNVFTVTFTY